MLEGRDLVVGLGLTEFTLTLFAAPTSGTELKRRPAPALATLLGLAGFFASTVVDFMGFTGGAGAWVTGSTYATADGLTNIPLPGSQSKYLWPCTLPSFLPLSSSSSTPIHSPCWK